MAVPVISAMVAAAILVRRTRMMMMIVVIVAAGSQSAHCEKGDDSGELLLVFQCKHTIPSILFIMTSPLAVSYRKEIGR